MIRVSIAAVALFASPLLAQDQIRQIDSTLKAAEAKGFSGVVRLSRHGEVLLEEGYGVANRSQNIRFTPSTVVQIGSNTKDFTAVALLQLQQKGLLNLGDPLSRFFPEAPADKKDITIRQLMRHRAGFPLGFGEDFAPVTRDQLIQTALSSKLLFTPGSRESYSNPGYSILAAIIEKVSGKTYDEYVRDNILRPLGMTHTGLLLPNFALNTLAHGYRVSGEDAGTMLEKPHAADGPFWNLRGNGGMLSTVGDMATFYTALFTTEKLLPFNARDGMFDPRQPIALAGSDLVNFFLYERMPGEDVELFIVSTNAAVKAPMIREQIASLAGLPGLGGGRQTGGDAPLARAAGKPVSASISALVDQFVAAVNSGDKTAIARFITDHYVLTAGEPSAEQRAERLAGVHNDLGAFTIVSKTAIQDGPVQVVVKAEREPEALLIFDVDPASNKIRRFGIQVGG
jgi:CubicO group peptidase (beta-lactamase class C family)